MGVAEEIIMEKNKEKKILKKLSTVGNVIVMFIGSDGKYLYTLSLDSYSFASDKMNSIHFQTDHETVCAQRIYQHV